jgi:hypothetical protein
LKTVQVLIGEVYEPNLIGSVRTGHFPGNRSPAPKADGFPPVISVEYVI